jgi:hypothetical protein
MIIANSDSTDGVDFSCSEADIAAHRPLLTVTYTR